MLKRLDEFPDSILVAGCQRSGTTVVRRSLAQSDELTEFWISKDDELDGARILAGLEKHEPSGRYCFQTTYLNEYYTEYFEHKNNFKLIWVLREPESVVLSMIYNWKRFPLNELFIGCGVSELNFMQLDKYKKFGKFSFSPLLKASYAYVGKIHQLGRLHESFSSDQLLIVDYNTLITQPDILRKIYDFSGLTYKESFKEIFKRSSASSMYHLSLKEHNEVAAICQPIYKKLLKCVNC